MRSGLLLLMFLLIFYPQMSFSYLDNDTYWTTPHQQPAWFESDLSGGFKGETVDGVSFTQRPVATNELNFRLHKFVIGTAFFYISNKGIIKAENDLHAVSIYLTLV
jgi:hypothetical protein